MAFLGIDVGTSGCKAILIDAGGRVLAEAVHDYPLSTPRPLWSEQSPEDWWSAAVRSIRGVLAAAGSAAGSAARSLGGTVDAIGLTGQMHGLVLLDDAGRVLRPAILWNDQRTAAECRELTERIGAGAVLRLTGNPLLPGFTAPKIEWVRKHEPAVLTRTSRILLPKDYLRYRLSGEYFTEVSDASGTSLFDVGRRTWSPEMLDALGVKSAWLAPATESIVASTKISTAAAVATGLAAGTPIVGGGGDQAAQAVGAGVVHEGTVAVTLGTSGVVFAPMNSYRPEPQGRLHAFCHAVPGKWHLMGVMLSAAGSLRWYRDALCAAEHLVAQQAGRDVYEELVGAAAKIPAGADGLVFLPYLCGERTPHPDPLARGALVGLTLRHTKAHLTRAVIEGVSFGLRDALELMRGLGVAPREIRVSGGGAKSSLWRQILADVFQLDIVRSNVAQGAAFGAAILAAVGVKALPGVEAAAHTIVREMDRTRPGADVARYDAMYRRYTALYPALKQEFALLGEFE